MITVKYALAISQAAEITEHGNKLIMLQQKVRIFGLTKFGLINYIGFIYYHPTFFQPSLNIINQGTLQIIEADNYLIILFLNTVIIFQIAIYRLTAGYTALMVSVSPLYLQ